MAVVNRDFDRRVLDTGVVTVGTFRLRTDHPCFEDSGAIREPIFVFPRTSCVIEHEGRPPFVTDTVTITYYNPGQCYRRGALDPRGDVCEWFSVREDVLRDMLSARDPSAADRESTDLFPFAHSPSDGALYLRQRAITRHVLETPRPELLLVEEAVLALLGDALDFALRTTAGPDKVLPGAGGAARNVTDAVLKLLRSSFTRTDSLEHLADQIGYSMYYMCRAFRATTGTTIHEYRRQLRLRRALELVVDSGNDLSSVAHDLGYSSHSHFTECFRKVFGVTPSTFRARGSSRRMREWTEAARAHGEAR